MINERTQPLSPSPTVHYVYKWLTKNLDLTYANLNGCA